MNQANTLFQSFHIAKNYEATATQAAATAKCTKCTKSSHVPRGPQA
jgi:hypothetical protein